MQTEKANNLDQNEISDVKSSTLNCRGVHCVKKGC